MMNQKEGVFTAVCTVFKQESFDGPIDISTEQRKKVIDIVCTWLINGDVSMTDEARAKHDTPEKMRSYTNGLVSNWIRKDKRLNGNITYQIKNPGSRAGSGDKVLKELRKLHKSFAADPEKQALVQEQIDSRLATLQAAKAKIEEIDYSVLPEELLSQLND